MPLMKSKSKAAFEHNVKAEVGAGKPMKQSLAIAYAMKRKSKKMSEGGMVEEPDMEEGYLENQMESPFQDISEEKEDFLASSPDPKPNLSDIVRKVRRRKMED